MGALQQLSLLIWKDIKLRIRAPILTVLSVIWPIAVFTVVAVIRNDFPPEQHTNCYYNAKAMPSSGAVDFMQSYLCDPEIACIPINSTSHHESNAVPSYTGASVSNVFNTLEPLISNENVTESLNGISGSIEPLTDLADGLQAGINITDIEYRVGDLFKNETHLEIFLKSEVQLAPEAVDAFLNSHVNVKELLDLTGYVDFYRITCNETELQKYLSFPPGSDPRQISKELCQINITMIPAIIDEFQQQLNLEYLILQFARFTSAISGNDWYDWIAAIEDAINVLEKLDTFPELQEFIKAAENSYDMLIALRDGMVFLDDIQNGEMDYETIMRSFEMLDKMFGHEEWWVDLRSSIEPFLGYIFEIEEKRNLTKLKDLYKEERLEMILEEHFGEAIDVVDGFKDSSVNLKSLIDLLEDEESITLDFCNGTAKITEFLEFEPKNNLSQIHEVLCKSNTTQFFNDLISGIDVILLAKEAQKYGESEEKIDWESLLFTLFNLTEQNHFPEFLNIDLQSLKYILDDDMTQAFMEVFDYMSNTSPEEWFTEETINYLLVIVDQAFTNQTWWNNMKGKRGAGLSLDTLLGSNTTLMLFEKHFNDSSYVIDALRGARLHPGKLIGLISNGTNSMEFWQIVEMICRNEVDVSEVLTFDPSVDVERVVYGICYSNLTTLLKGMQENKDNDAFIQQIIAYLSNSSSVDGLDLNMMVKDFLHVIEGLPKELYNMIVNLLAVYQAGDLETLMYSFFSTNEFSSANILNGTWASWLNSSFHQFDPELVYAYNLMIISFNDAIDVLREQLMYVCPEIDTETVTTCELGCESHDQCGTGRICCAHGCGTTCIDEVSPQLRKLLDGAFGLLEELSNLQKTGNITPEELNKVMSGLLGLQFDSFVCNATAIETAVGSRIVADLTPHLEAICTVNMTAVLVEVGREFDIRRFEMAFGMLFSWMPTYYAGQPITFEEFVINFEMLVQNVITAPEIFSEISRQYDLTFDELGSLFSAMIPEEYDTTSMMDMFNFEDLWYMFIGNDTAIYYEALRNIHYQNYISSLTIEFIPKLYGLEIHLPTLDGLFVDAPETRKLIEVSLIVPEVVELILSLSKDQAKMMQFFSTPFPFMHLCDTGTFSDYFELSNMSMTDVAAVEQQLCAIDVSLIQMELADRISLDEIMHQLSIISNTSIVPPPFNLTENIILQEQSNAVYAELFMNPPRITIDEKWLETTLGNLTAINDNWIAEMTQNAMNNEQALEQLAIMFTNESWYEDLQQQLRVVVHINTLLNKRLLKLNGTTIDLPKMESLFINSTEIRDFLELSNVLPEIVDIFFSLSVSSEKFVELLAMDDPFTVLCEPGNFNEFFILPPDSTTDLNEVEEAICKVNLTVLFHKLLGGFGIAGAISQDKEADFTAVLTSAMELSETVQYLIKNPPSVDVDTMWLDKTLEELEVVYEQWLASLEAQQNMQNDLENLQSLFDALMLLDDWESIENVAVVTQQIIAHLNGEIQEFPGQNLTLADIFPPATAEFLEKVLDQTSDIIGLQLGTQIDQDVFMAFLENEEDPLTAICTNVSVLESFVTVVEGVNITALQIALCSLDLAVVTEEWEVIFSKYQSLLEAKSSFNLTENIAIVTNFINSVTALIENPPNLEKFNEEWLVKEINATLHLLAIFDSQWTGEHGDNITLLDIINSQSSGIDMSSIETLLDEDTLLILHATNAYLGFINEKMEEFIGSNKTFVELLMSSLVEYLEAEGIEADVIEAIEHADFEPTKIIMAYIDGNLISSLCGNQETFLELLQFEESIDVSRIQEMICSVDLESWVNATASLVNMLTISFSPDIDPSAPFDWLEFNGNIEELLTNIEKVLANPPAFSVGIDGKDFDVNSILELLITYSADMQQFNLTWILETLGKAIMNDDQLNELIPLFEFVTGIIQISIEDLGDTTRLVQEALLEIMDKDDWTEEDITSSILENLLLTYELARVENAGRWQTIMCNMSLFIEFFDLPDSVDVSVLQIHLCNLNSSELFKNANNYYGLDFLKVTRMIDDVFSQFMDYPTDIDAAAIEELFTLIELIAPIITSQEFHDIDAITSEIMVLLNTPINELNQTRLEVLLRSLLGDGVAELIVTYMETAMTVQEMFSGEFNSVDIANGIEEYLREAGLREHVQPYIEIYNLLLESIIKDTTETGKFMIGLFNSSVPLETLNQLMDVPVEELEASLISHFFSIYELASIYNNGYWKHVFCNPEIFLEQFYVIEVFNATAVQQAMCSMNTTAFFIHASNAHQIDVLKLTAQINRIIYSTSPMTPLNDTEWGEVIEKTMETVELLAWIGKMHDGVVPDDYAAIMARLMALREEQNAQNMEDLMEIIEDILPYLNDYPWIMESMSSGEDLLDMVTSYQNISSSMVCDMFTMFVTNTSLWNNILHPIITEIDAAIVYTRHNFLELPERIERMNALLTNTAVTMEFTNLVIQVWPDLMESLQVVLVDSDQQALLSYIYSDYDTFETVLCDEGILKVAFGIDPAADLSYFVTITCSLHNIRQTEFVQEMYNIIDASKLQTDVDAVTKRPFECSVFYGDVENFINDVMAASGNLSRLLEGDMLLSQYFGNLVEFLGFMNELNQYQVDGLSSMISLLEQFTSDDLSTDLLKLILEQFQDFEIPKHNSTEILVKLSDILSNSTEVADWLSDTTDLSPESIEHILELFINVDVLSYLEESSAGDAYRLLCDESMFSDIFKSPDSSLDLELIYIDVCSEENHEVMEYIYEAIDIFKLMQEMKEQADSTSLSEDLFELFELFMDMSDESLAQLLGIPNNMKNGMNTVQDLLMMLSTGSEYSDIFKSLGKVVDDIEPMFGESDVYQEIAVFMDTLENLGLIRNLLGEMPNFKLGNMFHDVDEVQIFLVTELGMSMESAEDLLQSFVLLENFLNLEYFDSFGSVFCDEEQLNTIFKFPTASNTTAISKALCGLEAEKFVGLGDFLYKQLNVGDIVTDIVKFSINDQLENATNSVQKVNNLINQLHDTLPSLTSMNISNIIPNDILEDLTGTVSAQTANDVLKVFVCGTTVKNAEDSRRRRRETRQKPFEAESGKRQKRAFTGRSYKTGANTPFCEDLYRYMNSNDDGLIAWTYLKPVLLGKIPYSPNSPAARKIVERANYMFDEIKRIRDFFESWLAGSAELSSLNTDDYNNLAELLDNTFVRNLLEQQVDIDADSLSSILEDGVGISSETIGDINILAEFIVNITNCIELDRFVPYDTEEDMVEAAERLYDDNKLFAAVRFMNIDDATEVPHHVTYKIRVEIDNTPNTETIKDHLWRPGPNNNFKTDHQYLRSFIIIQDMLDRGIINLHSGNMSNQPTTYIQQMPYPCYQDDVFAYYITYSIPVFLTIAFIVVIAVMSYSQVYEKENGLEEAMMIMGLKSKINCISWFLVNFIMLTLLSIVVAAILKYGDILSRSDVVVVFLFIECFIFSIIMLSYMVAALCQRPNIAALVAALVYSVSFLPVFILYLLQSELDFWVEVVLCLLSPSAFCFGCEMLSRFEEQVVGATWSNFNTNPVDGDQFSFAIVCVLMVIDGIIYFLIGWYAKNVFPGTYGIGKPWYFPLMPSYWCECCADTSTDTRSKYKSKKPPIETGPTMEAEPTHLPLGVSCVNLTKKYKRKKLPAVDRFSFNFYEGQVSVLLGHNGAGKTTLMSMLTGFYSATSGQAYIGEKNIKTDAHKIRRDLGFCPQHNALYDNLTVQEHLRMYGTLKGVSESRINNEIKLMLETLEMTDMKDQLAKNLSGGMKRKLSVAIAFFAGSKVVILDEPTSGVDPNARRAIWDLIVQYKEGRTIILCTHFMDEADILGDRIAFLDHGQLKCCGSPMFLKYRYGSGYKLTLVKENSSHASTPSTARASRVITPNSTFRNEQSTSNDQGERPENPYIIEPSDDQQTTPNSNRASSSGQSSTNVCDTECVTQFVKSHIEGAKLNLDIASELSYNLPIENGQAQKFESFFNALDSELDNLHVTSYGITNTSLQEVFFKICGSGDYEKKPAKPKKKKPVKQSDSGKAEDNWAFNHESSDNSDISFRAPNTILRSSSLSPLAVDDVIRITGLLLVLHQFQAIMYKRFHSARRDIRGFFWTIIFPAVLIALALVIKDIRPTQSFPSLRLNAEMFEDSYLFFSNGDNDDPFVNKMTENLVYSPGIGTRCMPDAIDTSEYPCIDGQMPNLASEFTYPEKIAAWEQDRIAPSCSCGEGYSICHEGAAGAKPPSWVTNTTTKLQDLSLKMDLNEYLLRTSSDFVEKRYIGVTFSDIRRTSNGTEHVARAWYDNNGLHALPTSLNVLNNLILRSSFPRQDAPTYGITAYNHPLEFTESYVTVDALLEAGINYGISVLILCAFSMIPASFVMYLVSENINGTKRLHYVSGMPKILYVLSNLTWDLVAFLIPVGITLLIVYLFDTKSFASLDNLPAFATLLLLYGWAVIPGMTMTVRIFKDSGTAFIALFCANIFIAMLTNLPLIVKELFPDSDHDDIYETINYCSLIFPQYCLAGGLTSLIYNQMEADMYIRFDIDTYTNPFSADMLLYNYVSLAVAGLVFLTVAILVEYICICNCSCGTRCYSAEKDSGREDEDVRQERERVLNGEVKDAMVQVKNLKKVYRAGGNKIVAVDNLCVGIQKGECFGLLGVNGAGKTTTFKMLTGDIKPTAGSLSIESKSRIGYCPQENAVCDLTTGRELLMCYGLINGLSVKKAKKIIPVIARKLGMDSFIRKRISSYSGGMKRSLSTAISLIGNPNIVFMDEPTTGMDPGSRRKVWKMISEVLRAGKSVVLTSHSMEECEALCTRLAIMVNGEFKCIGSPQHVKSRFGDNFTVILRGADERAIQQITTFFVQNYPTAALKECHLNLVQYELPMKSTTLADIFGNIERHKAALMIEDYSVTQTSLEQVFLNFASKQTDGIEEPGSNVYDNFGTEPEEV